MKFAGLLAAVVLAAAAARVVGSVFGGQPDPPPISLRPPPAAPLDRVVPEVRLDSMELADLLKAIGRLAGVEIAVDWDDMVNYMFRAGVAADQMVHIELRLRDVTVAQVLAKVFASIEDGDYLLVRPRGANRVEILHVDSPAAQPPAEEPVARYYDVRPLLGVMERESGGHNHNVGGGLFGNPRSSWRSPTRAEEDLLFLVKESVAPESWLEYGGSVGECDVFAGRLIVVQTATNHRQVERLLSQIRDLWPEGPL
jgi:hypothetical protein